MRPNAKSEMTVFITPNVQDPITRPFFSSYDEGPNVVFLTVKLSHEFVAAGLENVYSLYCLRACFPAQRSI